MASDAAAYITGSISRSTEGTPRNERPADRARNRTVRPGIRRRKPLRAVEGTAAVNLIAAAWEEGIREFDTASGYGDSEAVLGTALHLLGLEAEATVVTKAIHLSPQQVDDPGLARIALTDSIESSRRRLGWTRFLWFSSTVTPMHGTSTSYSSWPDGVGSTGSGLLRA
nr:aldo/keto reductase [Tessaracoccus coleopterorum]